MNLIKKKLQTLPKDYRAKIMLRLYAGVAKPSPKMGQSLGPLGINMMQFLQGIQCRKVQVIAFPDRTFKFLIKPPETTWFLRKATGTDKFTNFPGYIWYDTISLQQVYEIGNRHIIMNSLAKVKQEMDPHLKHVSLPAICRMIIGQLASLGCNLSTQYFKPETVVRPEIKS
ncbi:unnamed protein product (macronuclear) [Paramecium tetraurelia]|uniref:Ribosomal protein L11 n=1 Tax=Paramecium tetraurelia TaxID=5888 RepID=A0CU64_PARTE|nr:uncharacterized protein GSPATT00010530001 [Paramecium tetraurelia]CAK74331.1 unnamed protein product [Paramecium tetraurelia]|eukprot:XP_001441728.1 hypothetical protein (macronuclear) [Paramecium tetraurelia strain d4-2]